MRVLNKSLLLLLAVFNCAGAEFPVPQIEFQPRRYTCYTASGPIKVDGRLNERAWRRTPWTEPFLDIEGQLKDKPPLQTRAKMLWDEDYLYIGAELEEPHVWATLTERDAVIFHDNDFEVFIDPDGDTHNYFELEVNAYGTVWDLLLLKPYRDGKRVAVDSWDIAGLETAVHVDGTVNDPSDKDSGWSVELAIPWSVLEECADKPRPGHGDLWRFNFSRVEWDTKIEGGKYLKLDRPEFNWVWSPQGLVSMHYPEMWGFVRFSNKAAGEKKTDFRLDDLEYAKWALRRVYYQQKKYEEAHCGFTRSVSELGLETNEVPGFEWPPSIILTTTGYEACLTSCDNLRKVIIREDGQVDVLAGVKPSRRMHAFYYPWYGNPETDGRYFHWEHRVLGDVETPHVFPGGNDVGANYYPQLGCYSSHDPEVVEKHLRQLKAAGIGTICISWWGEGSFEDRAVQQILDKAEKHGILVNFHIEPFPGRNAQTTREAIVYIVDRYGSHPAFYRGAGDDDRPMFYLYDSYLTPAKEWASLMTPGGALTIRGTRYDSAMIGLWVEEHEKDFFIDGGFDGFYTYFAVDGFTFGSTWKNWAGLARWAGENKKIFIPCVGPGYIDTRIRPWNEINTRDRKGGRYFDEAFRNALSVNPEIIGITSFNEWHEGTQIEPAVPKRIPGFEYEDYRPLEPEAYLDRTRLWAARFTGETARK